MSPLLFSIGKRWRRFILSISLVFIYGPILILIFYSFNKSKLATVWGGFSFHWYQQLFYDHKMLSAIGLSLFIATVSATVSVILGTISAFVLNRFGKFRGFMLLSALLSAPLLIPDVITGLALLLTFVSFEQLLGWPSERGMLTVSLAHITVAISYVHVVISARFNELDQSIEEAAMDLGAPPWKAFFIITLPAIMPSLITGWLLAFALSLDDLVIASFVSGPGATTLPILIFSSIRMGINPEINVLATMILVFVGIASFLSWYLFSRQQKAK